MALSGREKITIGAGAAVILVTLVVKLGFFGMQASATATADTIAGAIARLEQHKNLKASVARLAGELSVEVPTVDSTEQETRIRQEIARLAQQNQLNIATLRRMDSRSGPRLTATRPIQFQVSLKGSYDGLVKYIHELEGSPSPFVIRELSINATRGDSRQGQPGGPPMPQGGGRGGQNPPPTGQIQANLRLQAHLFPEVLKTGETGKESTPPAGPSGPPPAQGPAPEIPPAMPGMPEAPAMATMPTGGVETKAPAEVPPPPAGKTGRKTITIPNGPTIVIEGDTVTMNGQVHQVSVEEIEKGLQHLPPGATVVEE